MTNKTNQQEDEPVRRTAPAPFYVSAQQDKLLNYG